MLGTGFTSGFLGHWRSWSRASMAWKRSGVRIPYAPRKMRKLKLAPPDGGVVLFLR